MLEQEVSSAIKASAERGRVEVYCEVKRPPSSAPEIDLKTAAAILKELKKLQKALKLDGDIEMEEFLEFSGKMIFADSGGLTPDDWKIMRSVLDRALKSFVESRQTEGANIIADVTKRTALLDKIKADIKKASNGQFDRTRERLAKTMGELLNDKTAIDKGRLEQEVLFFAERADITEELVRIESHLGELRKLLKSGSGIGRKADFIVQELNREINTVGSKSTDYAISRQVVEFKSELEKMREQLQNVE
jgi:uncharacterized protein (TIGR00255 family)